MRQLSRHTIDIDSSFKKIQDGRVVALVIVVVVVVGAVVVVVARACRLWNHSIVEFACVPRCCRCCCFCYQLLGWMDHFKMFDDVTTTHSPVRWRHDHTSPAPPPPPPPVVTGNLYFRNPRIEFPRCTNFQHDWSILKFSMTSWRHDMPKLVSVPIRSLIWPFWDSSWRRRPRPSGQTGRQMLFAYSRHPWQMHPRNSFSAFHRANTCESGVVNTIIFLRIRCKTGSVLLSYFARYEQWKVRRFINLSYFFSFVMWDYNNIKRKSFDSNKIISNYYLIWIFNKFSVLQVEFVWR